MECDGEAIPLPSLQGIVVLNISSFMGGTNFWGTGKDDDIFLPPSFDDGILEVSFHISQSDFGKIYSFKGQNMRKLDCSSFTIECRPMSMWSGHTEGTKPFCLWTTGGPHLSNFFTMVPPPIHYMQKYFAHTCIMTSQRQSCRLR